MKDGVATQKGEPMIEFIGAISEEDLAKADKATINMIKSQALVRCKDCRWWDKKPDSNEGYCYAARHGHYSRHWEIGIYRIYEEDFYCADAERRTDEEADIS